MLNLLTLSIRVYQILSEIRTKVDQLVPEAERGACADCISDFQLFAGQLRSLVYRSMCPLLIKQNQVRPVGVAVHFAFDADDS